MKKRARSAIHKLFSYVDEFISFDDYSLSVREYGIGEPTVIIESGLNCPKERYLDLQFLTSLKHKVIAYDHAGIGKSTESPNERKLPFYVEELRKLLKYKKLDPPYILIGHSFGGHIVRYYSFLYPEEVAGLIFLDHPHEGWFSHIRSTWSNKEQTDFFSAWNHPTCKSKNDAYRKEKLAFEANCDLLRGKKIPLNIPVLMFSGNNDAFFRTNQCGKEQDREAYIDLQKSLLQNHNYAKQIVDLNGNHWPQKEKRLFVQKEINKFIKKCKKYQKETTLKLES
jgi:pimeloyl-ACP methyl ester carboxylesterase